MLKWKTETSPLAQVHWIHCTCYDWKSKTRAQEMGAVFISHQLPRLSLSLWKQPINRLQQYGKPFRGQGHAHD